jgi:multiple sugar transport system permease protein
MTTTTLPERAVTARRYDERIRRNRRRQIVVSILKHTGLVALSLVMVYPLLWLLVSSFKHTPDIFRDLSLFTTDLTTENYTKGWTAQRYPFSHYMWNSLVIAVLAIVGNLASCSLAAYAFARLKFRGRNLYFAVMLLSIMLPFHVVLVPQFIIFKNLGWLNTILPLVVPTFLATNAFFVFLMVQFIRGLPRELFEAARIDGAGHPRMFARITLPLMVPALATTSIFTFIWTWSDFFGPLIYLRIPEKFTAAIALKGFIDAEQVSDYGAMFAMSIVSIVPLLIIFMVGQRYLIKGFATTGIK